MPLVNPLPPTTYFCLTTPTIRFRDAGVNVLRLSKRFIYVNKAQMRYSIFFLKSQLILNISLKILFTIISVIYTGPRT